MLQVFLYLFLFICYTDVMDTNIFRRCGHTPEEVTSSSSSNDGSSGSSRFMANKTNMEKNDNDIVYVRKNL